MKQSIRFLLSLVLCACGAAGQTAQPHARTAKSPAAKSDQPKFKAIWEPVNYKEDLTLFDVRFTSKEEGWATGSAGTILHTKDGGTTWTPQLGGDPHAQGEDIKYAFMKSATHGWAKTWNTLFRTTDGESWQQITGDIRGDVFFVSDLKGFRTYAHEILVTEDGGVNWKKVFSCQAKMEEQGLVHESLCDTWALSFPTPRVGYAMGDKRITVKTEDGGATWRVLVGPEEPGDQRVNNAFFLDANTGYQVRSGGKLYRTADGGENWQAVIAQLDTTQPKVKFADREIGWSVLGGTWAYTVDGGKHWTSRQIHFPAPVNAFSLPARDHGYVVGEHGMIYRYRIVPIDYTSKGMIEAPMMPEASEAPSSASPAQPASPIPSPTQNVQIALDGAADLSPVYATTRIPANAGEVVALFSYDDQKQHAIKTRVTPIAAPGKYTINSQGDVNAVAFGTGTRYLVRHKFLTDIPLGRWRLEVLVDDKPLGNLDFEVVPAPAPLKLKSPVELWGSLTKGTEWSNEVRALHEPMPGVRLEFPGITEPDAEPGWLRGTQVARVVASDSAGTRIDTYRSAKLFSSEWMLVTDKGIATSKTVSDGDTTEANPPELMIASPGAEFQQSWRWHDTRRKPEFDHQHKMWGPLAVKTPNGEAQGYVTLLTVPNSDDPSLVATSIESHIVPGLGTVYAASVTAIPQFNTALHIEARLRSMKPGSGSEPEMRKLPGN